MLFNLMKTESSVDAEMRTQAHNRMIKCTAPLNHFQLFAWTVYKGELFDHVQVQRRFFPLSQCHR